jgi:hypothetical protein
MDVTYGQSLYKRQGGAMKHDENALSLARSLGVELEREWGRNHSETCDIDWPHPPGYKCAWPRPDILGELDKRLHLRFEQRDDPLNLSDDRSKRR